MSGIIALVHSLIPGSVTKLMLETPQAHTISIDSTTRTASITMAGKTFPIVACGGGGRWARCAQLMPTRIGRWAAWSAAVWFIREHRASLCRTLCVGLGVGTMVEQCSQRA